MPEERTLCIIKPDAVAAKQIGAIIERLEKEGLQVIAARMVHLAPQQAALFYAIHQQQPFFAELLAFISSGALLAAVLQGPAAVARCRQLIGSTDPQRAAAGTIRADFGTSIERNAIHAADSLENAQREIAFFFSPQQLH